MGTCKICSKKGFFITADKHGFCKSCVSELNTLKQDQLFVDDGDSPKDLFFYKYCSVLQDFNMKIVNKVEHRDYDGAIRILDDLRDFCASKGVFGKRYFDINFMRGYLRRNASRYEALQYQNKVREFNSERKGI